MAYFRKRGEKWSLLWMSAKTLSQVNGNKLLKVDLKPKKAAQEEVARVTNDLANGDYENSDIRFSQLVEIWLQEKNHHVDRQHCINTNVFYAHVLCLNSARRGYQI